MPAPQNISDLRRFMGMVTQLGKFTPNLAELSQPLRDLLSSKRSWNWGPSQREAFSLVKMELSKPSVLAHYSPTARVKVTADASSHGVGAVLTQLNKGEWRPVAFTSTETERRYAQIEKEALAVTWACEKFRDYILGRNFDIETDHKPLVPLLSSKQLDSLPPRVLRFRLRLMHYSYSVTHVPGKLLYTADTLSRAPATNSTKDLISLQEEAEAFIDSIGSDLFELNGTTCMLVVDYFSRYIEVVQVTITSSMGIIEKLKPMFSRQGIPEFMSLLNIMDSPISPLVQDTRKSNGQAERAVQIVKKLLRTSGDLYLSVLNYNATPMPWCGFSPSELLMGRKVRTTVPQVAEHFCPKRPFLGQFYRKNHEFKRQQEEQYNRRHQTPKTGRRGGSMDQYRWQNTRGYVTSSANTPRSYMVDTPAGQLRRNRSHLTIIPSPADELPTDSDDTESNATQEVLPESTAGPEQAKETIPLRSPVKTRSQTGTTSRNINGFRNNLPPPQTCGPFETGSEAEQSVGPPLHPSSSPTPPIPASSSLYPSMPASSSPYPPIPALLLPFPSIPASSSPTPGSTPSSSRQPLRTRCSNSEGDLQARGNPDPPITKFRSVTCADQIECPCPSEQKFSRSLSLSHHSSDSLLEERPGEEEREGPPKGDLPVDIALKDFVSRFGQLLPKRGRVCKGYHSMCDQATITTGDIFTFHFIRSRSVVRARDQNGTHFTVPLNSTAQFGIVYDPDNNLEQACRGHHYDSVADILSQRPLPPLVRAKFSYNTVEGPEYCVFAGEILHPIGPTRHRGRVYLQAQSVSRNCRKLLSEDCACHFSTGPEDVQLHLYELSTNCRLESLLPSHAVVYVGGRSPAPLCDLSKEVLYLQEYTTEVSVIATAEEGDVGGGGGGGGGDCHVIEMLDSLDIELQEMESKAGEEEALVRRARQLYEEFNPQGVKYYMNKPPSSRVFETQTALYQCVTLETHFKGLELVRSPKLSEVTSPPLSKISELERQLTRDGCPMVGTSGHYDSPQSAMFTYAVPSASVYAVPTSNKSPAEGGFGTGPQGGRTGGTA
eukprot:Em0017g856a